MSIEELYAHMTEKLAPAEELLHETLLGAIQDLGAGSAAERARAIGLASGETRIPAARNAAEQAEGGARRRGLSPVARDFARTVARAKRHVSIRSLEAAVEHVDAAAFCGEAAE
jgi:hypothetical protein